MKGIGIPHTLRTYGLQVRLLSDTLAASIKVMHSALTREKMGQYHRGELGRLAQWLAQTPDKRKAGGSNPSLTTRAG